MFESPHTLLGHTPVGNTPWVILAPLALRTTGFPATLMAGLASPELTELAAKALDGMDNGELASAFSRHLWEATRALARIASLERFREALAWQNPATIQTFDSLRRQLDLPGRNAKRRDREYRLLRYISRYCSKTETIGFFGPLGYARMSADPGHLQQRPSEPFISYRKTYPEAWAVRAVAASLQQDERIATWLPLRRPSQFSIQGGQLVRPRQAAISLTPLEVLVFDRCDGSVPRHQVVSLTAQAAGLSEATVSKCVSSLEQRRFLLCDANIPLGPTALETLEKRLLAITDETVARLARERISGFIGGLRELEAAHGNSAAVLAAQARVAGAFLNLTGSPAARKSGMMYAGRGIAYEECLRNTQVEFGTAFMNRLNQALPAILVISQWVTWATATAYEDYFRQEWTPGPQRLDSVWFPVLASFYGSKRRPIDGVLSEFRTRWKVMLTELSATLDGPRRISPEAFLAAVKRHFPSPGPGWRAGAVHSPDWQICLNRPGGWEDGDYTVVLGEIHVGTSTLAGPIFEWPFDGYAISHYLSSFIGKRYAPVFPEFWGRNTGRSIPFQPVAGDVLYAFDDVEGAPAGIPSIVDISVAVVDGQPVALLPDGTHVNAREFFGFFLASLTIDAWKSLTEDTHTPRLTVGDVVLMRESWVVDVAGERFLRAAPELDSFLLASEWRRRAGLPERVYVKLSGEVKPFYVDFSSPLAVSAFLIDLRGTMLKPKASSQIVVSEALPGPDQAWVVDAQGHRYLGEIRMMVLNPESL